MQPCRLKLTVLSLLVAHSLVKDHTFRVQDDHQFRQEGQLRDFRDDWFRIQAVTTPIKGLGINLM